MISNQLQYFSKQDTNLFKGLAILMIVIHNYLHFEVGFFLENESGFNPENVRSFINYLIPLRWYESFSGIAGFLGHYGVQLFVFFSAYGLSMQGLNGKSDIGYFSYLKHRLKKLYFLLLFGIAVFLIINYISSGSFYGLQRTVKEFLMIASSFANFNNKTLYSSFSGPFWYFGLMLQLYLIFPLLFKMVQRINFLYVLVAVYVVIMGLYFVDRRSSFSLFGTVFGHLPEVLLGIYFAQKGITRPRFIWFLFGIIVFAISQYMGTVFPFSFLAITVILLFLFGSLGKIINDYFGRTLIYIGEISMILFVVNGPMRHLPFFNKIGAELRAERIFLYLIVLFVLCHFLHKFYDYLSIKLKV